VRREAQCGAAALRQLMRLLTRHLTLSMRSFGDWERNGRCSDF
jgi:hypothetical protein